VATYYNEFDPHAAEWLKKLILNGCIPEGDVDDRDINDVKAEDLRGYTQHHFFAGIGGWAYALRLAGWPDDRPVLTGSPPCQPFSNAGKQKGINDERHLSPVWLELVAAIRPAWIFGEQVAAAVGKDRWLDDLLDGLEAEGYTTGAIVLPASMSGAPHIRQRIWFTGRLADADCERRNRIDPLLRDGEECASETSGCSEDDMLSGESITEIEGVGCGGEFSNANNSIWRDVDWLFCRDGKWRPVESIIEPRLDGLSDRLGYSSFGGRYSVNPLIEKAENKKMRLRGYGNAIVPQVAAEVIRCAVQQSEEE